MCFVGACRLACDACLPADNAIARAAAGVQVFVESTAIMKILNSTMDFVSDELREEFIFDNPNAKGLCGCGESFHT